ncbi:hypothetical protein C4564_03855 [Candidatus Microgenomates bacterium]|nr:MAG: hypothetical protein C4564_03855 [Candidatus Microgenomates bacterium]
MKKLIDLYITYQKLSLKKMQYFRISTFLGFANLFVWVIIDLLFFKSIFSSTGNVAGWDFWDSVLLIFTLSLFWDIFWRMTSGGIVSIPDKVHNGDISNYLLKPVNPLAHLAVSEVGILDNSLNTPVLFIYYFINNGFPFSLGQIFVYILMVFMGVGIFTWIMLAIVSLSFWATNVDYLANIYWELQNIARYPKDIFDGFLANLFLYILPVFFIANIPVNILRQGININNVMLGVALNIILFLFSKAIWKRGLSAYNGTSV